MFAEALEDFLQNFLSVSQDESGKTRTSPKYMDMLVSEPFHSCPAAGRKCLAAYACRWFKRALWPHPA
jgi:hypothetical protein